MYNVHTHTNTDVTSAFSTMFGRTREWYVFCLLPIIAQDWRCCSVHSKVTAAKLMLSLSSVLRKEHFIGRPHVRLYRLTTHRENNTQAHGETVSIRTRFLLIPSDGARWRSTWKTIRVTQSWREHRLLPYLHRADPSWVASVGALVGNVLSPTSRLLQTRANNYLHRSFQKTISSLCLYLASGYKWNLSTVLYKDIYYTEFPPSIRHYITKALLLTCS